MDGLKLQKRKAVHDYFIKVAKQEIKKKEKHNFEELLDDDKGCRILFVMEKSAGDVFMTTALLKDIYETYPNYHIYFATSPSNFELVDGCPYIYKVIPFMNQMEHLVNMEGASQHQGYFDICFLPFIGTQKILNYMHNGIDKISLDIKNF
jgi:hypothetical protein